MPTTRAGIAAIALACLAWPGAAYTQSDSLEVGRKMLAEDNPGELWVERGKRVFAEPRGPKRASLEQCDFGLGPGKLEGAYAAAAALLLRH